MDIHLVQYFRTYSIRLDNSIVSLELPYGELLLHCMGNLLINYPLWVGAGAFFLISFFFTSSAKNKERVDASVVLLTVQVTS